MGIQNWSEDITVVELADDPQFSDELDSLMDDLQQQDKHIALNFAAVSFLNSSNIAKLLKLRKITLGKHRRLILCGVNTQVWGVFLVTGLDNIFEFTNAMSTALTTLQLGGETSQ